MNPQPRHLPIVISGLPDGFIARPQVNFGSVKLQGSQNDLESYVPDASLPLPRLLHVTDSGMFLWPLVVSAPPTSRSFPIRPARVAVEVVRAEDRR
jgi:hypothetical protein